MRKFFSNIYRSWKHIPYTWKHYRAFVALERELTGKVKHRFHDWDKLMMYIFLPWLGTERISAIHKDHSAHHPKGSDGSYKPLGHIDFYEAVIDWECAAATKPDKPLNARETMERYYPELRKIVEHVLYEYGLGEWESM